jgi:hypothetical protein
MGEHEPQADKERRPQETYDPEMTDADEGNDPPQENADREDEGPVERPL